MISRRRILAGASALTAMHPLTTMGAVRCLQNTSWAIRTCEASLDLGRVETVRQRCKSWCWAACIQTVFAVRGFPVQQEDAVIRLFGNDKCQGEGATLSQIISTISGNWTTTDGRRFRAAARELPLASLAIQISEGDPNARQAGYIEKQWKTTGDARELVEGVGRGQPLINLAVGHATVLETVTYQRNELFQFGPIALTKVIVRDPWPDSPNRRELTAREVRGTFHVIAVEVS